MSEKKKLKMKFGKGLFSNGPFPVVIEEFEGEPTFMLSPMTLQQALELKQSGVDLEATDLTPKTINGMKKSFAKFVHGWDGMIVDDEVIEYNDENRDKLALTKAFGVVMGYAQELAVKEEEDAEKN